MSIVLSLSEIGTWLAQAATQPAGAEVPGWAKFINSVGPLAPIVLIFVVLILMTSRSKKRQEQQRQSLLDSLKRGDRVQTIGGVLGNVVEVRPDRVLLKVDESNNTKVWFARSAIHKTLDEEKAEAK